MGKLFELCDMKFVSVLPAAKLQVLLYSVRSLAHQGSTPLGRIEEAHQFSPFYAPSLYKVHNARQ